MEAEFGTRAVGGKAIAADLRNNPDKVAALIAGEPACNAPLLLSRTLWLGQHRYSRLEDGNGGRRWNSVGDLYDTAFHGMHARASSVPADHGTLFGDLHNAADFSLVIFRDLLDAAVCAKSDASIAGVKDLIEANLEHAEHELGMLIGLALRRAKGKQGSRTPFRPLRPLRKAADALRRPNEPPANGPSFLRRLCQGPTQRGSAWNGSELFGRKLIVNMMKRTKSYAEKRKENDVILAGLDKAHHDAAHLMEELANHHPNEKATMNQRRKSFSR